MTNLPRVFLSYSHKDKEFVGRIATLLHDRKVDVWFDEWKLPVGSSHIRAIHTGIQEADFIVLFLSRNAMESPWVQEEYEAGKIRQIESRDKVIVLPARLDDCDFPLFMTTRIYADFRHSFVGGFTKLLDAILGARGVNEVDKAFSKYSKQFESYQEFNDANPFKGNLRKQLLESLEWIRGEREKSVRASVECAATAVMGSHLEKWLGNATRDYLQYKIFSDAHEFLSGLKTADTKEPLAVCTNLLEHLYGQINAAIRLFGLASHRGAEPAIAHDLNKLFGVLLSGGK